jgi:FtsZ-interacting cell division protein ZipA
MDGLLLWLIVLGAVAVVAVYVYNRREEARFRRVSESAFGGQDGDALMDSEALRGTPGERIEPQLQGDAAAETAGSGQRREPRAIAEPVHEALRTEPAPSAITVAMAKAQGASAAPEPARAPDPGEIEKPVAAAPEPARPASVLPTVAAQATGPAASRPPVPRPPAEVVPDPIAYCAELSAAEAVPGSSLEQLLRAVGPLSPRVRLEGRQDAAQPWTAMERNTHGSFPQVRAGLQLVDRRGVVGKQDVIVFQSAVARCAASIPASANIPEAEPFLARARELDGFCAEVDVVVGINLVAARGRPFLGTRLRGLAEAAGFHLADGAFAYPDTQGGVRFTLENQEPNRLLGEALRSLQTAGVTLLLDVPRLADGVAAFDEMVAVGRQLARSLGGTLVDDNNVPVTETGLEQIRNQLRGIYARMQAHDIPAGSPLALRLFS